MKRTKILMYLIGAVLVASTSLSFYQLASANSLASNDISLIFNLVIDLVFLFYVYKFLHDKKQQGLLIKTLNKPASETLNKKLPVWLIFYIVVIAVFILYFDFLGKI